MAWLGERVKLFELDKHGTMVLEIGSFDVNGSPRQLFRHANYWGIDLAAGKGVDSLATPQFYAAHISTFDVVICAEVLEHDPNPFETFNNIRLVLKKGGIALITVRGFTLQHTTQTINDREVVTGKIVSYGYHGDMHFGDYWRFGADGMRYLARNANLEVLELVEDTDPNFPGYFLSVGK